MPSEDRIKQVLEAFRGPIEAFHGMLSAAAQEVRRSLAGRQATREGRLARIAARVGLDGRAAHWRETATRIHGFVCERAWSERRGSFVGAFWRTRAYRAEEDEVDRRAVEIIRFLALDSQTDVLAQNLPYGDQRKLEIAVALAARPKLLLLDEPAAGMNPDESRRLMNVIRAIVGLGVTVLLVEHHMKVVMGVCDRIIVLDHGVKIAEGTPGQVANDPDVIRVYLGRGKADA